MFSLTLNFLISSDEELLVCDASHQLHLYGKMIHVIANGTTKFSRLIWYTRYWIQLFPFFFQSTLKLVGTCKCFFNFFWRWTAFQFFPAFYLSIQFGSRDKNINIEIFTGLNFFSHWFPIFPFRISWVAKNQNNCILDYKSAKTESDGCLLQE